jgi:putative ABC transport system substrate-binding protein
MQRREFFTLVGGVAVWPVAARAQQPSIPVVGFLDSGSPSGMTETLAAFHRGLNPAGPQFESQVREMQGPTQALGLKLNVVKASKDNELDAVFASIAPSGTSALIVANDQLFIARREQIVALAQRYGIPTSFAERESVTAGGLMSYAASFSDSFRQVGSLVGRILKGARPQDLPVQQPIKFELVINIKTAKALGITVPITLQASADEVIE